MTQLWQLSLWWLVLLTAANRAAWTQKLYTGNGPLKPQGTIFYMDGKGSYKYAFASGNGLQGEQSANRANEVTGFYTYYDEEGAPYMVKYRAGVLGYQPEVIRAPTSAAYAGRTTSQTLKSDDEKSGIRTKSAAAEGVLQSSAGSAASTLKFVQHAMQSMQTQPMQVSFSAHQTHLPAAPPTLSLLSNAVAPPPPSPPQQQQQQQQQLLRPYAYSYLADQSAHSESADRLGNVMGKYSYYDEAGYHDLSYSAGDETGFVIRGGNLVKSKDDAVALPASVPNQLVVNFSQLQPGSNYNYRVAATAASKQQHQQQQNAVTLNSLEEHSAGGDENTFRSLRKFRRYAKW